MAARKTKTEVKKGETPQKAKINLDEAKAAFEKNRMKMEASKTAMPKMESKAMPPFGPASFPSMSFMPPMQPYMPYNSIPFPSAVESRGSLFESIGNMLRLSVDVMNAGLAGGLQIMKEFSHHECGCHPRQETSCCDPCRPTYHSDCCCQPSCCCDCCDCSCTPSVHNCC